MEEGRKVRGRIGGEHSLVIAPTLNSASARVDQRRMGAQKMHPYAVVNAEDSSEKDVVPKYQ